MIIVSIRISNRTVHVWYPHPHIRILPVDQTFHIAVSIAGLFRCTSKRY